MSYSYNRESVEVPPAEPPTFAEHSYPWPEWYQPPQRSFFLSDLVQSVADDFGISYGELIGDMRHKTFVDARSVVGAVLKERGWSYPRMARAIGRRDHSTAMNWLTRLEHRKRDSRLVSESLAKHMKAFAR